MTLYDISKTNFIIISKNNINYSNKKNGIKINIKGKLPEDLSNNQYLLFQNINNEKLKNRVIFSGKSNYNNKNLILLTQQNLNHNIKLIYKKDLSTNIYDLNQPRIIFKKYSIDQDISFNNQFLFTNNSLKNVEFQNQTFDIENIDNHLDELLSDLNKIIIGYNVYQQYKNSNFFKFNFNDFINTNTNAYNDISNNLFIKINDISCNKDNNNMFNNISYENIYKIIDNSNLLLLNNSNYFINSLDNSNNILNDYFIFNSVNNLTDLSINFQTLNESTYENYEKFKNMGKIYFFVNKYKYFKPEYNYFKNKIILNNNFTYLNNKILNNKSNFYSNHNLINTTNKVYLSFGNSILGLTKLNLFNNFYFTNNKIFILKDNKFYNNYSNLDSTSNYLIDDSSEEKYDYSYYRKFVTYNFLNLEFKLLDYDLSQNFNEIFDLNNYINGFQNNYIINEKNISILPDLQKDSHFYDNNLLQEFVIYDSYFDKLNYNLKINNNDLTNNSTNNSIYEINIIDNNLNIDFKFNYKSNFNVFIYLQLKYDNSYNYLNDYLINFSLNINTEQGLNFDNINCIYIYHNPLTETDPSFLYPNNNIEIDYNPTFDTLSKVIERNDNVLNNKTFTIIPQKNASNLSKKQIIGLIGLNNIPKLLSIEPYDESFIEGRGFLNQYSINDECLNYNDKVLFKLNSQKHTSVKERNSLTNNANINSYSKKMNYVKLVNNRKLNTNIKTDCSITSNNPNNITNYYTPFKLYRKR